MMKFLLVFLTILFVPCLHTAHDGDAIATAQAPVAKAPIHYERPSLKNLSKLYWGLALLDYNNDAHVDNYLAINQCDIYRDYFSNEFEWKNIRQSGRDTIKNDIKSFPHNFEFTQPLKLGNYDLKTENFDILEAYKIPETTRFELYSDDANRVICDKQSNGVPLELEGYPRSLIVEFSRPFSLSSIKVHPEIAKRYIALKMKPYNELRAESQTPERLYDFRDAYVVLQIRVAAPKSMEFIQSGQRKAAQVLGVLDGYKIYADPELTLLMHEEKFKR